MYLAVYKISIRQITGNEYKILDLREVMSIRRKRDFSSLI